MNKSFSEQIKQEILEHNWSKKLLSILLYSFIRSNANIDSSKIEIKTTQKEFKDILFNWINTAYSLEPSYTTSKKLLKIKIDNKKFIDEFSNLIGKLKVYKTEEYGAYIAGAFLGKGWVNDPISKFYHFELRCKTLQHSLDISEAFDAVGVKTISILKDGWHYTYIKKSSSISDILKLIQAQKSSIKFENQRIQRDVISSYTKMEAIESYNFSKTKKASDEQVFYFKKLFELNRDNLLSSKQKNLIKLRIKNPNLSLFDLMLLFNDKYKTNISKSTVNSWLHKGMDLAKERL